MADTATTVDSATADATATVAVVAKAAPAAPKAAAAAPPQQNDLGGENGRRLPEPLLDENPNRWTMLPIKYPAIWEMYKKAEASFWTGEFAVCACVGGRRERDERWERRLWGVAPFRRRPRSRARRRTLHAAQRRLTGPPKARDAPSAPVRARRGWRGGLVARAGSAFQSRC